MPSYDTRSKPDSANHVVKQRRLLHAHSAKCQPGLEHTATARHMCTCTRTSLWHMQAASCTAAAFQQHRACCAHLLLLGCGATTAERPTSSGLPNYTPPLPIHLLLPYPNCKTSHTLHAHAPYVPCANKACLIHAVPLFRSIHKHLHAMHHRTCAFKPDN
jgi:hypothetical protein